MLESKLFWILVFYGFWAVATGFVLLIYKFVNTSKFRSEATESTEVGYQEDPTGRVLVESDAPDLVMRLADRTDENVLEFGTFTVDLNRIADWLISHRITTVAMESTGVFWIPLYQVLESRCIEVFLVNARHVKAVPGRKTDVKDCQWLQHL